ncbi:MAG: sarcosine oxidase subunit gamma [Vulcanimicrobiaceae bacterium]
MVDIARPVQTTISRKDCAIALGPCARFSLRLSPAAAAEITAPALKLDMPINTMTGDSERMRVRLGPDEWLLVGPEAEREHIADEVEGALTGFDFSLVDIGHRNVAFQVAGPHARELVNGGCPLDLDDATFPIGSATRTVFGKAEIVLIRREAEYAYRIECLRSFGPYVEAFFNELMREFEEI